MLRHIAGKLLGMTQDFTHKITLCIRKDLPEWAMLNAAAHIGGYFGYALGEQFVTGKSFVTADRVEIPRNTQYGIAILRADAKDLRKVTRRAHEGGIEWMGFTREMLDLQDDDEVQGIMSAKNAEDIDYLGIGLYGGREELQAATKGLQAWR